MTTLEFCIARREAELPAFVRVLAAIPPARLDYRPDPKARTAGELAWVLACEEAGLLALIEQGTMEWKDTPAPALPAIVAAFEESAAAVNARLAKLDAAAWERKVAMTAGGTAVWEDTLGEHGVGLPVRRHPPPRPAQHLPAPDGQQGAVDLRPVGRRRRAVTGILGPLSLPDLRSELPCGRAQGSRNISPSSVS